MAAAQNRLAELTGPGNRVLVVGLGRSGIGVVRLLVSRGARVTATDSAPLEQLSQDFRDWAELHNVELAGGGHSDALLDDIDLIITS
ncbi:MAG: UDP-N-acetylmuramoylalanine--D-glutamate ligase, partial [Thermodesulfobacteriota bacterium]